MNERVNFLLAGVGGQGTILASDVLVNVGLGAGLQAKQAEVHGMSQRGGSVTSHVRWGPTVFSPLIGAGEVDVLLAFEKAEAMRNVNQLRHGALALVNLQSIEPITVTSGGAVYPSDDSLRSVMNQVGGPVHYVDGVGIATNLGNVRTANVVLLGALSALLERIWPDLHRITPEIWLDVICQRVPAKHLDLNRRAFSEGRLAV